MKQNYFSTLLFKEIGSRLGVFSLSFLFLFLFAQSTWASSGETCSNPIVITALPFNDSGNTSTYGNNYGSNDRPPIASDAITNGTGADSYLNGDEVVFAITPTITGQITINTTNDDDWVGLWVFTGCPFSSTVGYHTATSGATRSIPNLPVSANETYYIVISTWPSPQSTSYTIDITGTPGLLAPLEDCEGTPDAGTASISPTQGNAGSTITASSAGITLAEGLTYQWQKSATGTDGWTDISGATTATSSITADSGDVGTVTHYRLKVTCTDSGETAYSTTATFTIALEYCTPTGSSNNDDEIRNFTLANLSNDSGASEGTNGYSDYSGIVAPAILHAALSYVASLTSGTGSLSHGAAIWIDYNNNGTFEDSEMVAHIPSNISSNSTVDFPAFTVPASTPPGNYRLRVQYHYNKDGELLDPCVTTSPYSETEDYSVTILEAPTCLPPTDISLVNFTSTTAEIEWTAGDDETSWNISWGTPGYTPGDSDEVGNATATTTNYEIAGLSPVTSYHIYVQADCGGGDESPWTGPISFRTDCDSIENFPYIEDFEGYGTGSDAFPDCWERTVTYTSGGTVWPSIVTYQSSNRLRFQSLTDTPTYAVSPPFAEDIDNLRVSFMLKREGDYSGTIDVGVMSNASDTGTFELVQTINPDHNNHEEYIINLNNIALSGPNNYIAFRHNSNSSAWYYWLDDFKVVPIPTCLEPSDVVIAEATPTTAVVEWTANNNESSWTISWGEPGYTPGDTDELGSEVVTQTSYEITGLNAETHYDIYVNADCGGGDESYWVGPINLYTGYCIPTTSGISGYITNFTADGGLSTISNIGSGSGTNGYSDFTHLVVEGVPGDEIEYTVKITGTSTAGLKIWVDWNNNMTFDDSELLYQSSSYSNTYAGTIEVPPSAAQGMYRMRIGSSFTPSNGPTSSCVHTGSGEFEDYTIEVVEAPSCIRPSDVLASNITADSVDINWTPNGTESNWNISWGTPGYTPSDSNEIDSETVSVTNYQITGLSANTSYDVYVQANCGSGDLSSWTGPLAIRTACDVMDALPYVEDFDTYGTGSDAFPACWERPVTYTSGTTWPSIVSGNAISAPNSLKFQSQVDTPTYAVSPPFAADINELRVSFMLRAESTTSSGTMELGVMSDPLDISTFELVETIQPADTQYHQYVYNLNNTTLSGSNNHIALRHNSNSNIWYYWLDDFVVEPVPSCLEPSGLTTTMVTPTTIEVEWVGNNNEGNFNISWGAPGYTPGDSNEIGTGTSTETTYEITGLTADTYYDVYVQGNCGDGDLSYWTGPLTVFTGYCDVSTSFSSEYLTAVSSEGAVTDFTYTATSQPSGSYSNQTALAFRSYETQIFDVHTNYSYNGTNGVNIWIDWNNDMQFDSSELVASEINSSRDKTLTISVPAGTPEGDYRMRVRGQWNALPPACGNVNYGSTVDFKLQIVAPPTCLAPTDLTVSEISASSASVSWTENGTATEWEVLYGVSGFDPDTQGTIDIATGTPEHILTDLTQNTRYDVYVTAVCEEDDSSFRVGPISFFTTCTQATIPYLLDFEMADTPNLPNCTSGENAGNGNMWETLDYDSNGFTGNVLVYRYSSSPANAWFYTQGIQMHSGVDYEISYKYGNASTPFPERLKVAMGTSPLATQMTTQLADHTSITNNNPQTETVTFTVPEDGIYYFGFNAYSTANQFNLYVDDILIDFVNDCEAVQDVAVTDVSDTSVTVSWTASSTATNGYTVNVFAEGADPVTDTPVANETVSSGVTTATVDGLTADTSYDVYVVSHCDGGSTAMSGGVNFTTDTVGMDDLNSLKVTYYPNPVDDRVTISANDVIEKVVVYNVLGQKLLEVKTNNKEVEIDMSHLSSGSYLLTADSKNGSSTFRLLKN